MLKFRSFDVCKNAVVPIIAMLDHSELDTEILDVDMETIESNNYRRLSRDNGDANDVLAMI